MVWDDTTCRGEDMGHFGRDLTQVLEFIQSKKLC